MSLTDVMSAAGLSSWAELALLIFVIAFVVIAITTFLRPRKGIDEAARLPLENGSPQHDQHQTENVKK